MSASLVGSEMCIRDRCGGHDCDRCAGGKEHWSWPKPATLRGVLIAQPVSYTHLTLPTICSV
eukprot:6351750-Alexandrium_andersonii.AAC.1